jgi:hypothetical protein
VALQQICSVSHSTKKIRVSRIYVALQQISTATATTTMSNPTSNLLLGSLLHEVRQVITENNQVDRESTNMALQQISAATTPMSTQISNVLPGSSLDKFCDAIVENSQVQRESTNTLKKSNKTISEQLKEVNTRSDRQRLAIGHLNKDKSLLLDKNKKLEKQVLEEKHAKMKALEVTSQLRKKLWDLEQASKKKDEEVESIKNDLMRERTQTACLFGVIQMIQGQAPNR